MVGEVSGVLMGTSPIESGSRDAGSVPFSEARAIVATLGVRMTIGCGFVENFHRIRLGLTTSDDDPMLTLRADKNPERWLADREQSAPDRWDYETEIACLRERFFVELEHGGRRVALAFAPVAVAVLTAHGWIDDPSRTAEACIEREDLSRCLDLLGVHPPSTTRADP